MNKKIVVACILIFAFLIGAIVLWQQRVVIPAQNGWATLVAQSTLNASNSATALAYVPTAKANADLLATQQAASYLGRETTQIANSLKGKKLVVWGNHTDGLKLDDRTMWLVITYPYSNYEKVEIPGTLVITPPAGCKLAAPLEQKIGEVTVAWNCNGNMFIETITNLHIMLYPEDQRIKIEIIPLEVSTPDILK